LFDVLSAAYSGRLLREAAIDLLASVDAQDLRRAVAAYGLPVDQLPHDSYALASIYVALVGPFESQPQPEGETELTRYVQLEREGDSLWLVTRALVRDEETSKLRIEERERRSQALDDEDHPVRTHQVSHRRQWHPELCRQKSCTQRSISSWSALFRTSATICR